MFFCIVFIPLLSTICILCFNRILGNKGTAILATILLSLTSVFSIGCFLESAYNDSFIELQLFRWFYILGLNITWSFSFESLNLAILVMITFISFLIHLYSVEYFSDDPHQARFMLYLTCFTNSMIFLVSSNNLFQIFFGWELIGLFSYLLINFWFSWIEANKSSIKAMIVNRIGDLFLSLFFFFVFFCFKSINISLISSLSIDFKKFFISVGIMNLSLIDVSTIFLFLGIAAKSAQVPFRTWLVNAMSAPSPVSALIHAATLVTSGIFLILKFSFFIELSFNIKIISFLGIFTAIFSALTALIQNDAKRIVAYSTCSQLGYMAFSCGVSQYNISFFHLINRGCFKALLFLGVGSLIHNVNNKQDIRTLGHIFLTMPSNYSMFIIGSLALSGIPFLSGFYSKDTIIELSFENYSFHGMPIYFFSLIVAILTSLYSTRLIYYIYIKNSMLNKHLFILHKEAGITITITLSILSLLSILNGYLFSDLFCGLGSDFFNSCLYIKPEHLSVNNAEFQRIFIKNIPLISVISTILIALVLLNSCKYRKKYNHNFHYTISLFLINRWFFDVLQNKLSLNFLRTSHLYTFKLIDKGFIEKLGPSGVSDFYKSIIVRILNFQSGFLSRYLLSIFLGWFFFLSFNFFNCPVKYIWIFFFSFLTFL